MKYSMRSAATLMPAPRPKFPQLIAMVNQQKLNFLLHEFPALLGKLSATDKGQWGMMNAQQMVEHFILSVKNASGKLPIQIVTPADQLEKIRTFMFSDKPFRENTKNPL